MELCICWFRRNLRFDDNATLFHSLKSGFPVLPVFIFDPELISGLPNNDKRLIFIYEELVKLKLRFENQGSVLLVKIGRPEKIFEELIENYQVSAVYADIDYEPYSISRDQGIRELCQSKGIGFYGYSDHVLLDPAEVVKPDRSPYHVYTPYSKKWLEKYETVRSRNFPSEEWLDHLFQANPMEMPQQEHLNIQVNSVVFPSSEVDDQLIADYQKNRDFPGLDGTSRLGVHLRFGTISIRKLASRAFGLSSVFLNELIWREFYQMILFHHPEVVTRSFKPAFDQVQWLNRQEDFAAWCEGKTGYPLVDAGMRQLIQTGFMHNRLRMVTASFLTKHLLIDWRWGEAFFARYLLDYELASNNGGWQWAAGSGCDAVPYFRVFSPKSQQERFDPDESYIRQWLPEYKSEETYIKPVVDHAFARNRAIEFLRKAR